MNPKSAPVIPRPGEGKRGPEGHLGYLLRQASVALRTAMDRALVGHGLTSPQFAVLTMIVAYPGASGADLARLTFLTPQTINVIVRNLERDGAIEKTAHAARPDPAAECDRQGAGAAQALPDTGRRTGGRAGRAAGAGRATDGA